MKIGRVGAAGLRVSVPFHDFGIDRTVALNVCHVEVETDDGLIGYGFTAIVEGEVVAHIVNAVAGPLILGEDLMTIDAATRQVVAGAAHIALGR